MSQYIESPVARVVLAVGFLVIGLWCLLPGSQRRNRVAGTLFSFAGVGLLWSVVPLIETISMQTAFWLTSAIAIAGSLAAITSRKPIYSAIWFAVSLLGVAGLFLLQGSQFLGIATVAVYAGAIVVTFLFVLMLAQPEGHSFYDRISWGRMPRIMVPLIGMLTVGLIAHSIGGVNQSQVKLHETIQDYLENVETNDASSPRLRSIRVNNANGHIAALSITVSGVSDASRKILNDRKMDLQEKIAQIDTYKTNVIRYNFASDFASPQHVASLGGRLFTTQLIGIQVAGCLLFVALVGAISIASHQHDDARQVIAEGISE